MPLNKQDITVEKLLKSISKVSTTFDNGATKNQNAYSDKRAKKVSMQKCIHVQRIKRTLEEVWNL